MQDVRDESLERRKYQRNKMIEHWSSAKGNVYLEEKDKEIRRKALDLVGHKNGYIGDLRITRSLRSGIVDYKKLVDDYHVDVEKYRKEPVISYRFS